MVKKVEVKEVSDSIKKIQAMVEQEEVPYIHNTYHSAVTLLHPSGDDFRSLTIHGYEYRALDMDPDEIKTWLRSSKLRDKLKDGIFEVVAEEEVPRKVNLPPELELSSNHHKEVLKQILGSNEALALDIINLSTAPRSKNDTSWLREHNLPVLRAALYMEERQKKRAWMLEALKKNIKQIEQMVITS